MKAMEELITNSRVEQEKLTCVACFQEVEPGSDEEGKSVLIEHRAKCSIDYYHCSSCLQYDGQGKVYHQQVCPQLKDRCPNCNMVGDHHRQVGCMGDVKIFMDKVIALKGVQVKKEVKPTCEICQGCERSLTKCQKCFKASCCEKQYFVNVCESCWIVKPPQETQVQEVKEQPLRNPAPINQTRQQSERMLYKSSDQMFKTIQPERSQRTTNLEEHKTLQVSTNSQANATGSIFGNQGIAGISKSPGHHFPGGSPGTNLPTS